MKRLFITGFLTILGLALHAQEQGEFAFKFTSQSDMFLARGNETELNRIFAFVEQYKSAITSGQLPLYVNGYCASFDNKKENLQTARLRSRQVKSLLILKKDLKEENFITVNHSAALEGKKDVVTVTILLKDLEALKAVKVSQEEPQQPTAPPHREEEPTPPYKEPEPEVVQPQPEVQPQTVSPLSSLLSIRTNLLYWLAGTPNIGIEYKPTESFGILVNGAWSHWIWSSEDKHHRTWLVSPEVRYYLGANKNWFLGAEGHLGEFNFKFKETGYQGDLIGGGITGGYKWKLSRVFDLDFSLGLGYTQLKYDTYYHSNNVMVKKEAGLTKDFFGPTQAGVSLIWKILK
jgi:hypothetical protein